MKHEKLSDYKKKKKKKKKKRKKKKIIQSFNKSTNEVKENGARFEIY